MVKLVNILYLLVLSCLFTLILMSRLPGEQTTDDAWPTWAKELNENNPIHLRSVTNCDMDSRCTRFETCADKTCVRFWPRPATQTSACHLVCEQDVRLYEDHFYLKNITDVHAFEGITSDTCVMSYHLMGNTPGLSPKEYETRHSGSDVRSETMDNNVKVVLCKVRDVPRDRPIKKLSIPAVAIPAVTVAIPTYNRIGYVQLTSAAFQGTFPAEDTWIFDDTSSEYSTQDLVGWYGTEHVWQSKKRLKADAMARHILEWFLKTKYDVLVLLDSDLIVAPDWHAELRTGLRESTGLLSLYRSGAPKHKSVSCGDVLCQQPSMGNAGTVWRRDLAKRMLAAVTARDGGFDWGWSEWCTKNKVPMEALKKSAVLHIGMYGSWSHESTAEKSVGFPMGELAAEVRERAEMYLKGAKPTGTVVETWQSYITSTKTSQNTIKTVAYDSRNIWAEADTCNHAGIPERPTILFDQWSAQVCSKYSKACSLFKKAFVDTWDNGITWLKDGTVFLVTGDIPLMWLRDSSAQVTHYLALAEHSSIQRLIEGVLRRQMKWIELDVYGSAFRMFLDFDHVGKTRLTDWDFKCGRTIHVAQHDYEMDSLAYVVRLAYQYWKKTGRTCWMQNVQQTWHRIVDMWILEQDHSKSTYTYPTLEKNGQGTPVCKTGMSWAGMRPSDDKMKYHYNIPGQLFAAKALEYMEEMSSLWSDDTLKQKASKLRLEIIKGVEKYGVVDGVLAYETDGCGHHVMADDANIPSLLSLPYLDIHRPEYKNTRLNILSDKNPWWSEGGIGSPHTNGRGHPWHLAMIMEGWDDKSTLERVLKTAYGGSLHESVTMSGGSTRKWFGWANALFSEWLMQSSKYIVIMPSVKRNNNQYLKKTLDTLDVTKPKDVPVLFINANKPAEKHEYLINWCNTHSEYDYVVPPMVSEELVQNAIKMDKRGDTPHFLRWRTMETSHALFGFEQALKTGAKYIIWLQDDIIVRPDMFEKLEDLDIICLQDGKNYCGAVGYLFSRKFVKNLIPKIKKNILNMPIDWIIFDLRPVLKLEQQGKPIPAGMPNRPRRIPLVHHIGIKSTKTPKKKDITTKCHMVDLPGHVHVSPRKVPRKIVQIFPYGHEFDILKMKIQNNVEFTDEFIIIEGDKTFALERKPYYLDENINQVNHMAKIRRLKLNIRSTNKYSWDVQNEMRLSDKPIREYFTDLDENSMIVSSDLDEIIKPNVLCLLKHYDFSPMPSGVKWKKFLYGFFNEEPHVKQQWNSFGTVEETPVSIRHKDETWIFPNGGWHCSWCMQMEGIMRKLIHSPYVDMPRVADNPKFLDKNVLCNYVQNGRWFLDDQYKPKKMQISKDIPIAVPPYLLAPPDCDHHLSIIIPFREKKSDAFSQGSGREQHLRDWTTYMCLFLPKVGRDNVDVRIIEQTQEGPFNKGALFNIGYHNSKDTSDYMVLHDVDHIPENEENNYAYREEPTHMCVRTSQFNYQNVHQASLGGAFMITMSDYKNINGYSNLFLGWGGEDDNFGERVGDRMQKLSPSVGHYKALDHKRTMGLDETPLFKNHPTSDLTSGISDVKWHVLSNKETKCGNIRFIRTLVDLNTHKLAIIIPFRSTVDKLAQGGADREQNLKDWLEYMSSWLKIPADVFVIEQSDVQPFNKGALFNIGYDLTKDSHDYMILHDVDSVPLDVENTYEWKDAPTVLRWHYNRDSDKNWNAGGVLQMSHKEYSIINGYSNIFWGWGFEDTNMALRIKSKLNLNQKNFKYRDFKHERVSGLHKQWNKQYTHNERQEKIVDDSGISDIKYTVLSQKNINAENHLKANRIKIEFQYTKGLVNSQGQPLIKTQDLFNAIDYNAPENKGPWKQGWDYDYDGRFKDGLTVHVVPHSHNDPGWIKTYHTYYSTQTKHILDTVVAALTEDPRRTFIWAEISYFSLWWDDATQKQKEQAKKLVAEKRLDFVTGGWVMNDEASVTARATRWHLQEGREWLQKTFGITPQYSWAIDPFGHSAGQAQVLKELGYKGMLIQRVHYAVKKQLAQKQQLEFQWQTPAGEIFTHMMPFYSYDGPHTCGPDPSVCCQFDFARISGGYGGCPWHKTSVSITDNNVAERSKLWLDQVYKKAMLYRGQHVLVPVGDDFRYQTMDEAHKQFTNYQKMFDWIKVNVPSVSISFSTLSRYFDAVVQTQVPKLQGSFFPYSDRVQDYWTGYFNSRIFYKGYDRLLESLIATAETKCPTVDIHLQKRALGLFQHHDGITGTAKSAVVQDYYKTMQNAVSKLQSKLKTCLDITSRVFVNPLSVETPTMKANEIRPYQEDKCEPATGLQFETIQIDEHGRLLQINDTPVHESLVWRSNTPGPGKAGAYLMSVTSKEDVLQAKSWTTCVAKKYKQVETVFDMIKRRIRVYNDGTVEFIYAVDIHARNNGELWAVYKPEWTAERLCSDVHGLTWECHTEIKDAPLQAKFWPMPTMAWLASSTDRMTFTGAQPTGVGFHEGAMVLMLDRRGNQDDARGLGQGITDSRPVEMRFGVLMEGEHLKERASEKALLIRNWMLNPAIEIV